MYFCKNEKRKKYFLSSSFAFVFTYVGSRDKLLYVSRAVRGAKRGMPESRWRLNKNRDFRIFPAKPKHALLKIALRSALTRSLRL